MIIFTGQLTGKCKDYILRRESKFGLISGLITATIFSILAIIGAFLIHWIVLIFIPVFIISAFLTSMPPNKKSYSLVLPSEIIIDTHADVIISRSDKFHVESSIEAVTMVVDMGEWYHIYVESREGRFVCQKDLLSKGTLEEFEKIFEGKIKK